MEFLDETPLKEPLIFDTHSHYDDERFSEYSEDIFTLMHNNGVGKIITCGCNEESSRKAFEIAKKYDFIYFSAGIHPCDIKADSSLSVIEELLQKEKCVALGEIGLDYYWESDNKEVQKEYFEKQLLLANKLSKPVLIHDREAHADTLELIKKHRPKGVVHSFSGSAEMAKEILGLGMYLGVGGVITFKNARKLPEVVEMLPLERLLLETDAPYLAPVPYRSKTNNSAMIYLTAEKIAEIKGTDTLTVLKQTYRNATELFGILI